MTKDVVPSSKHKRLEQRERLRARLLKIDEEIKRTERKAMKAESARETRQWIIVGRSLLTSHRDDYVATAAEIIQSLSRPQDREAFGLPALSKNAPNPCEQDAPPLPSFDDELTLSFARDETIQNGAIF